MELVLVVYLTDYFNDKRSIDVENTGRYGREENWIHTTAIPEGGRVKKLTRSSSNALRYLMSKILHVSVFLMILHASGNK